MKSPMKDPRVLELLAQPNTREIDTSAQPVQEGFSIDHMLENIDNSEADVDPETLLSTFVGDIEQIISSADQTEFKSDDTQHDTMQFARVMIGKSQSLEYAVTRLENADHTRDYSLFDIEIRDEHARKIMTRYFARMIYTLVNIKEYPDERVVPPGLDRKRSVYLAKFLCRNYFGRGDQKNGISDLFLRNINTLFINRDQALDDVTENKKNILVKYTADLARCAEIMRERDVTRLKKQRRKHKRRR